MLKHKVTAVHGGAEYTEETLSEDSLPIHYQTHAQR